MFSFSAVGTPDQVIGQLLEADTGRDGLGEAIRDLLIEHFRFPASRGPGARYVFAVTASGSSEVGAIPSLHIETDAFWVPYVHAATADKALGLAQRGWPVPEGE